MKSEQAVLPNPFGRREELYFTYRQEKEDEMGGACSTRGEMRNANNILTGIPEGKRPLGRPKHRSEDNFRVVLRKKGWVWTGCI
jgi:hypothetical protein